VLKNEKTFDCRLASERWKNTSHGKRKKKRTKEEEDIKPYLRLARFRVGERQQLRCEKQPMSKVATTALTRGGRALRGPEYPLSLADRSVSQILRDTFVGDDSRRLSSHSFPDRSCPKGRHKERGGVGQEGGKRKESSSGAATCGLAFLSRRPEPALREVP